MSLILLYIEPASQHVSMAVLLFKTVSLVKMVSASNGQIHRKDLLVKCVRSSKWGSSWWSYSRYRRYHVARELLRWRHWVLRVNILERRGQSPHVIPHHLLVLWRMIVRDDRGRVSVHRGRPHDSYTLTLVHQVYLVVWKGQAHFETKAVVVMAYLRCALDNGCPIDRVLVLISAITLIAIVNRATGM